MRYLVFNLLVVGALAFLLFDGDPPTSVRGAVDKVAVEADRLIAKGKSLVEPAKTERPAPPEVPSPTPATPPPATPPPATPPKAVETAPSGLDPAVARRRAEVLGEAPDDGATEAATSGLMAPGVRRSELNKLAEDMELMFVEKAGR